MKKVLIASLVLGLSLGVGRLGVPGPLPCVEENGDSNGDNALDLSDAIYLLGHLFQGGPAPVLFCDPVGQKEAECADTSGDSNGDNALDLSDAVYLLGHLFQGGPGPLPKCLVTTEICDSGMDDDGDGLTDCADVDDCATAPGCGDPSTLPATGQTLCYEPLGSLDPPAELFNCADDTHVCFGQDGSYQAGCPNDASRFVDNLDGTITDTCTGLMWQKDTADASGDGAVHVPPDVEPSDQEMWCDALDYCENLIFATHSDWRLPNIRELYSILDYGTTNPPMDTAVFGMLQQRYWSSTSVNSDPSNAWYVTLNLNDRTANLRGGDLHREGKNQPYLVRAVRGTPQILPATGQTVCYDAAGAVTVCATGDCLGQDAFYAAQGVGCPNDGNRFVDNLDGTVTDTCTNLLWQKDTADLSGDGVITDDHNEDRTRQCTAVGYCQGLVLTTNDEFKDELELGGGDEVKYEDWRLPNIFEIHSIVDYGSTNPAMDGVFGPWDTLDHDYKSFGAPEYWSSSICGGPECIDQDPDREAGHGFVVIFGCCHEDSSPPPNGRDDGGAVTSRSFGRQVYVRALRGGL